MYKLLYKENERVYEKLQNVEDQNQNSEKN